MGKQIDYVIGNIQELSTDREAGWNAFYKKDYENEELRVEIARLKGIIRELKSKLREIKRND